MEAKTDFKYFCDDELTLSTGESTVGRYIELTIWDEDSGSGEVVTFTSAEAREFADWIRRYADKIDEIELP